MNSNLLRLWGDLNTDAFGGKLNTPAVIDWMPIALPGPGLHGFFGATTRSIGIDPRFDWTAQAPPGALANRQQDQFDGALYLVVHEMVHQALFEWTGVAGAGHGQAFVNQANAVQSALPELSHLPPANLGNAGYWPFPVSIYINRHGL